MRTARQQLAAVLGERTMKIRDPKRLRDEIAAFLLSDGHVHDIDLIMREVVQYRLTHGIVEATLVSAHPIDKRIHNDVEAILREHYPHAKAIVINERQDESVVGGVRIDMPGEQLDMSVQAKLNTFKRLTSARKDY